MFCNIGAAAEKRRGFNEVKINKEPETQKTRNKSMGKLNKFITTDVCAYEEFALVSQTYSLQRQKPHIDDKS